ncbi:MAG: SUF system NifU family Fe-S cluster assembly protein [Gammaproteobacteria bacterium]|jgi:nitrogen fixation NifU-like protein|nr:SUF system NifU family Fe-S cluster assembly protein [Gammaproteobacteria bacterium]
MNELHDLYQEVIFDHNRNPRHCGKLDDANRCAKGFNPLCGDRVTLYLKIDDDGVIRDVGFDGSGCAISVASASLMTENLIGKTEAEAEALFSRFHDMLVAGGDESGLGKLQALSGVKEFPSRIKCATLAWHALHTAISGDKDSVSTE